MYNTLRLPKSAELQNSLYNYKMSVEENETTNLQQLEEVPLRLTIEAVTVMVEASLSFSSSNNQLQPM